MTTKSTAATRLRRALELHSLPLVLRILGNDPSPLTLTNANTADKSRTSLHLCALYGLPEIARHLLDLGHESQGISRDTDGATPLMLACQAGPNDDEAVTARRIEVGKMLIRLFPEHVCIRDRTGMDAFSHAAASGTNSLLLELMREPLDAFALEALQDFNLNPLPPLPTAPESTPAKPNFTPTSLPPGSSAENKPPTASTPASAHPLLSVRDTNGNTPLHHASAAGQLKTIRLLLQAGADGSARNAGTWTPVDYSASVSAEVYLRQVIKEQLAARGISTGTGRNSPAWGSP
ncbi:MAG: hypothetical protein Q9159_007648, partial [Coniocarpon cinnabarinum]